MNRLFGLSGKKGSGKDLAGRIIKEYYQEKGKQVGIYSFAWPVKKLILEVLFPEKTPKELELLKRTNVEVLSTGDTLRDLYIKFTEGLKEIQDKDIFIKILFSKIKESTNQIHIITDVRFQNELEACLKYDRWNFETETILINLEYLNNDEDNLDIESEVGFTEEEVHFSVVSSSEEELRFKLYDILDKL